MACGMGVRVGGLLVAALLAGCGAGGGGGLGTLPQAPALTLLQVVPASADAGGGATVTLVGSGFSTAVAPLLVHVGARVVVPVPVDDSTLRILVPAADGPGAVDVRLVTGEGVRTLAGGFTYTPAAPPPPFLLFTPPVGSHVVGLGGTRVDITVGSFAPLVAPSVTFAGIPAASVTVLSTTQVRVEIPAGLPPDQNVAVLLQQGASQVASSSFRSQGALAAGSVTINEFLPNPGTLDANRDGTASTSGDEFVELVNRTAAPIDLTAFTLHDAAALRHTFPNPTTVPVGGSLVIFGSGNPTYFSVRHESGHAQLAATGDLGLNNTGDTITLRDPAAAIVAQTLYLSADVTAGKSRNAVTDGGVLPVPAASVDYSLHDALPGAVGTVSPGTRAGGLPFP
jgi:hypothetical protein